jgi:hypothetical protein
MNLENMVKQLEKNMVISDIHIPFQDDDAVALMKLYAKDYKPDNLYINGDMLDFYSLSSFDKSPDRKETLVQEVYQGRQFLHDMRKVVGEDCNITFLEGNHEARLQRYFWRNPEMYGLDVLELSKLLDLKKYNVGFIGVDPDYWSADTGHAKQGDALILHGDSRLNGAKGGIHGSYNTMKAMGISTVNGHDHKLGLRFYQNAYSKLFALGTGCLCKVPGNADYEQGFGTFTTTEDGVNVEPRTHRIQDGELWVDGNRYYMK